MSGYLKKNLRVFGALSAVASGFAVCFAASPTCAWTSAHLFNVTVTADIAASGPSKITTDARFVVEGGYFHGFDFTDLQGARLDEASAAAFQDDQQEFKVTFKRIRDGRIRALLADDKYVKSGGITFRIVHQIDFVKAGALRSYEGRARFDWTPLIWDVGLDNMRVQVRLPESEAVAEARVDPKVAEDYVSTVFADQVSFIKFRPVKWYPMRVVMDFNATYIPALQGDGVQTIDNTAQKAAAGALSAPQRLLPPPQHVALFIAVCFMGFLASVAKARHIAGVFQVLGKEARFVILKRTSFAARAALALFAVGGGAAVQIAGYLAAGIPLVIAAVSLFLVEKADTPQKPRGGGVWREMNDQNLTWYGELYSSYKKNRSSVVDITAVRGAVFFAVFVAGIFSAAFFTDLRGTDLAFATVIDGLILATPAWFAYVRAELPMDGTLEGFGLLLKWQKSLVRIIGRKVLGAKIGFFVREDKSGPIEVRLRAELPIQGIRSIETAAEGFMAGTLHRVRTVFVLRMEPGAPITRKLAACPHAAEHHLTPDLQEEIIVLRNRRGITASGLSPLRAALHRIGAQP